MKQIILAFFLLALISLNAQDFDKAKMDSLFSLIESNQKGLGSISFFEDGKEVYSNAFGYANIEKNIKDRIV